MSPLYIYRLPTLLHRKIILPTDRCWKSSKNLKMFFHSQVLLELTTAVLILEDDEGENCLGPSISFCPFHIKLQSDNTRYKLEHFNTNRTSPQLFQQSEETLMTQIKWKDAKTCSAHHWPGRQVDHEDEMCPRSKAGQQQPGLYQAGDASRLREVWSLPLRPGSLRPGPALSKEVGLEDFQRSLPTSTILQFCRSICLTSSNTPSWIICFSLF